MGMRQLLFWIVFLARDYITHGQRYVYWFRQDEMPEPEAVISSNLFLVD